MNKKEQAMVADLKEQVALSWPRYEEPQPIAIERGTRLTTGWFSHSWGGDYRVSLGCSSGVHHNPSSTERVSTQGAGTMYVSRLDALKVARHKMSKQFAKALARIDAEIEEELLKEAQ